MTPRRVGVAATLGCILAIATATRLLQLSTQPGGLFPDEAAEGLSAQRLLHGIWPPPVFFDDDGGREALFAYIVAPAFRLAGDTTTTLRGVAAALGVSGVIALAAALRRFGWTVALAAAGWAAGSLWLIAISRDGMRNVLVPLVGALTLGALLRWHDRPTRTTAALAGAATTLGLWTYQPLKLEPLLVVVWLVLVRRQHPERLAAMLGHWRSYAATFVLVAAPMAAVAVTDPSGYFGRGVAVSAFNSDNAKVDFATHIARTLGMFAVTGDPNPRHDVAALPLLPLPLAALALVGAVRAWRRRHESGHALILVGVPIFLLPPLVAVEGGSPHFLRALGLAPFVGALVGLGCTAITDWLTRRPLRHAARIAVAILFAATAAGAAQTYLHRPIAERYDAYAFPLVLAANASFGGAGEVVILDDYAAQDIRFLDAANPPTVIRPGIPLSRPELYSRIVALNRQDIAVAAGENVAQRATVYARNPAGQPAVWVVTP